jgi:SPOR domain
VQGCNLREYREINLSILSALIFFCVACDSQPKAGNLSSAVSRYEEGRYAAALSESQDIVRSGDRATSAQGALIAGMSSYKIGNMDQAQKFAIQASSAQDGNVSGGALVLLGDINLSQHHPQEAAVFYSQAAEKLSGSDAVRARECAERARNMVEAPAIATVVVLGKERDKSEDAEIASAPAWTLQPKTTSAAPLRAATKSAVDHPAGNSVADREFTIRAGSYSTQAAAKQRSKDLASDLKRSKAPTARIDTIHSAKGEELFAVRIGTWPTRAAAEKVLNLIARRDLMVGAIDSE